MTERRAVVFVVDDDASVLKAFSRLLSAEGFEVRPYGSARKFLDEHDPDAPGCAVLDMVMPGLTGLDLQSRLSGPGRDRQIVFVSGRSDVPMSVSAMKGGAVDFLTKPVNDTELIRAVQTAIERDLRNRRSESERQRLEAQLARLTARERDVFDKAVKGRLNKQIAVDLGISEKTVKLHRARFMHKLGVRSIAELVHLADRAGAL